MACVSAAPIPPSRNNCFSGPGKGVLQRENASLQPGSHPGLDDHVDQGVGVGNRNRLPPAASMLNEGAFPCSHTGRLMPERAVVIAGGGPTGLMLAGELALANVDVVIVERRPGQDLGSVRAGGLQSRT